MFPGAFTTMKIYFNLRRFVRSGLAQTLSRRQAEVRLAAVLLVAFAVIGMTPHFVSQAQKASGQNRVWDVSSKPAGSGTMVSIAADGPVDKQQNWQDGEGYHLVLPNTVSADSLKAVRGVKVRRVGTSLEVVFQTKPGSKVNVQTEGNEITLLVDKKLDVRQDEFSQSAPVARDVQPPTFSYPVSNPSSTSSYSSGETAHTSSTWSPSMGPTSEAPTAGLPEQAAAPAANEAPVNIEIEDEGLAASIFSGTSVFIVLTLGLVGLLVTRKLRSRQEVIHHEEEPLSDEVEWVEDEMVSNASLQMRSSRAGDAGSSVAKSPAVAATNGSPKQSVTRIPVTGPTSLYGAYRIDQEVGKLLLGQPHRMDVLASRAIDDRRAIETSLIKGVNGDFEETARRRAREALEEYGFVARQCATLLLAPDAFERTSAARALGEIKSESALPFLLEGLYDSESIVRNQAVVSIGELKLPSAIGALLDIARTHPDFPSNLLSRTLSACSVEGLDFFDAMPIAPAQLGMGYDLSVIEQITHLEPVSSVEELPKDSDDENLTSALSAVASSDFPERAEALKMLAQFRVQRSVAAITEVARQDSEPNLRALAIASLGAMDHESVFPAILIAMADDTREVRASAARALNRLSFDRADAYVRVIETGDEATIRDVARACIQAGIVSQNLDRLESSDHRQAYETFSLICLLARAKMCESLLDAIASHQKVSVRLKVVHLLGCAGQPETFEQFQELAVRDGVSEEVKTALLEVMYKLDQKAKQEEKETVEASEAGLEPKFEAVPPDTGGSPDSSAHAESDATEMETQTAAKLEAQTQTDDLEL
jgi:HEAT repeat protein